MLLILSGCFQFHVCVSLSDDGEHALLGASLMCLTFPLQMTVRNLKRVNLKRKLLTITFPVRFSIQHPRLTGNLRFFQP